LVFGILDTWTTVGLSKPSSPEPRAGSWRLSPGWKPRYRSPFCTRASGIIGELSDLGIVECREVGRTVLVSLARHSVAGELIDRLAHLGSEVLARLRALASELEPAPETLLVFGSFARGEADANSDLDILAVRSPAADPDKWAAALSVFAEQARELAGGPVQVLDYDLDGLRRKAGPKAKVGREFWNAVRRDAIVLTGSQLYDLIDGVR
jgi:predicted nucleotidyltransferase